MYIKIVTAIVRPHFAPIIMSNLVLQQKALLRQQMESELKRPLDAADVGARFRGEFMNIRVPVKFRRVTGGRRPTLELGITDEIMQRLVDVDFERAIGGKTVDVLFRIPKDLVHTDGEPEPEIRVTPVAV